MTTFPLIESITLVLLFSIGGFQRPVDFDVDIDGHIYVVDRERDMLLKYSAEGDSLGAISGTGDGQLQFDQPMAVFAHRGTDVLVADYNNHRIQRFDRNLDYVTTIYLRDDPDERHRFGYPRDVTMNRQGDILIVDGENRRVLQIDASGSVKRTIGDIAAGAGRLVDPSMIATDDRDFIYVLDGGRVLIYDPFGTYVNSLRVPDKQLVAFMSINDDQLVLGTSGHLQVLDIAADTLALSTELAPDARMARALGNRVIVAEGSHVSVFGIPGR